MTFETKQCPLCGTMLNLSNLAKVTIYSCPAEPKSHYEVECDGKKAIQHIYVYPYAIDNYDDYPKSRVFKWRDGKWKFIDQFPKIEPQDIEELKQYLMYLVPPTGSTQSFKKP